MQVLTFAKGHFCMQNVIAIYTQIQGPVSKLANPLCVMEPIYPCFKPICLFCTWLTIIWVILSDELKITTPQHVPLIIHTSLEGLMTKKWPITVPWFQISPRKIQLSNFAHFFPPFFFPGTKKKHILGSPLSMGPLCWEISIPSTCGTTKSLRFQAVHQGVNNVVMIRLSGWWTWIEWTTNTERKTKNMG